MVLELSHVRLIDELAASGKTVVMSTHLLLEAEGLADQVVMIDRGADVVAGPPDELVRRYFPKPRVVFDAQDRRQLDRWSITRSDLRQLKESRDFWLPMVLMAALFFVVIPTALLFGITRIGSVQSIQRVSTALDLLPTKAQAAVQGVAAADRTSYALALYLFAPLAVIVPLTISTAVGANTLVGER